MITHGPVDHVAGELDYVRLESASLFGQHSLCCTFFLILQRIRTLYFNRIYYTIIGHICKGL